MPRPLLRTLALYARRHYRAIFLATAALVVAAVLLALQLRFDSDVMGLLPRDAPEVRQFREALEEFGSLDYFLLAVRLPEEAILAPYELYVDMLGERLGEVEGLGEVQYRLGRFDELLAEFLPSSMVFLGTDDLERLAERLTDEAVRERARELRRLIETPQSLVAKELIRYDPLGLAEIFLHRLEEKRGGVGLDWSSGYFVSPDRQMFLLLAKPERPAQDVEFARRLVDAVEEAVAEVGAEWREDVGVDGPLEPQVALGGRHVIAINDAGTIQRDVIANIVTSMGGVLVLFLLAFRRFGPLLYAFVPLSCGLILTFGLSSVAFGTMSAATSGVAALLIGLGIDFIIVSYGRFVEERRRGSDLETALANMSGSSGRAVVVGGVTSAATFFSFGVTDFTGLYQMGYLTGAGILLCMVAVLVLLPAMLAWSEDHHSRRQSIPRRYLHGFGAGVLLRFCLRHPRPVLLIGAVLTVIAGFAATGLRFEDSVQAMRPKGNPGVEVRDEIAERFGIGFDQMMLVVERGDLESVLAAAETVTDGAARLVADGVLLGVDGIGTLLPSAQAQARSLDWLAAERSGRLDFERIRTTFEQALRDEGVRSEPFAPGLDLFAQAVSREQPLQLADVQETVHGAKLLRRYLRPTASGGWKTVVYLHPPAKTWRREAPPQAHALADSVGPNAYLSGSNVVSRFLRERVLRDAVLAAALGFVLVGFLLWLDYRHLRDTLLSLAPLTMGLLWMLGAMALLDIPMNFMNIFVSTMIIGIGVDYGVHMIHRHREFAAKSAEGRESGLAQTGKAIGLAAMSTIVGFGSLSRSHYPGLSSMGLVAILGAVSTCLVAVTVLPAYLAWRETRR